METNEVMENVENIDVIDGVVDADANVNPMVVGGVVAVGVAAIGLGYVLWDKAIKPGVNKAKIKIATAKADRAVKKNEKNGNVVDCEHPEIVIEKDSKEQE